MTKFEELIAKLKELFELDKADLDFGIHRIIKSRHGEIMRYLQGAEGYEGPTLQKNVTTVLGELQAAGAVDEREALKAEIVDEFGRRAFDTDGELVNEDAKDHALGQRWGKLNADPAAAGARSQEQLEAEVYSHLHAFFSRYYEDADFISLRRTRAGSKPYAIPYSGEEVLLHWANKDQYYIKSTEDLKDYTFTVDEMGTKYRVHFKCARMDAVLNNNKAARAFVLDEDTPITVEGDSLVIPFHFKIFTRNPTEKQQVEALTESLNAALENEWKARVNQGDASYTGSGSRTLLQKHLHNYTRKNTSDYFIHKDLGGFLRQELDFYVKNEVMYLDDVDNRPAEYLTAEIRKIKAIRSVAQDLIAFLAQFENFQKKLWLKKKFVTESHYCITLDRIIEHAPELLADIAANEAQREEWVKLYSIDVITAEELGHIAYPEAGPLTEEFLRANPFLMVDTCLFSAEFKWNLLGNIDDIDAQCDGLMVSSENFQALNLLQDKYKEKVRCVYIDPPYNTAASEILYKNEYRHSSWLALIKNRLEITSPLMTSDANICATIDDVELNELCFLLDSVFGEKNECGIVPIRINPSGRPSESGFALTHEYALFYRKSSRGKISRIPRTAEQLARFNESDDQGMFEFRNLRREGSNSDRADGQRQYFPIYANLETTKIRVPRMEWREDEREWIAEEDPADEEVVIFPINDGGIEKNWRWSEENVRNDYSQFLARIPRNGTPQVYYKYRPKTEGTTPLTLWTDTKYSATESGTRVLKNLFDRTNFSYPKSIHAVEDCIRVSGATDDKLATVLDYFAGSGTTGHAVINLNREDEGNRKYILVEMGEYFDTVTKPRIQKVVYSPEWKDGKPTVRNGGISHCFKYLRLESYEDTLNNLTLEDRSADLLGLPGDVQEDYLIHYMLDVETRDSLVNLERFADPWGSTLKIYDRTSAEAVPKVIDLVETFNYLLGLCVREFKVDSGFLTIEAENPAGETVLVIWRKLSGDSDWAITDNAALASFLADNLRVNPADTEYAAIYINGDTTLEDPHKKILLTEQVFHELMFADAN